MYRHFVNQKNSHWIVTLRRGLTVDTRYAINQVHFYLRFALKMQKNVNCYGKKRINHANQGMHNPDEDTYIIYFQFKIMIKDHLKLSEHI